MAEQKETSVGTRSAYSSGMSKTLFKGFYISRHRQMSDYSMAMHTIGWSAYMWAKGNIKVEFKALTLRELKAQILNWWASNGTPGKAI